MRGEVRVVLVAVKGCEMELSDEEKEEVETGEKRGMLVAVEVGEWVLKGDMWVEREKVGEERVVFADVEESVMELVEVGGMEMEGE